MEVDVRVTSYCCVTLNTMTTTISIIVNVMPSQSRPVALAGSRYLISDQAMSPPTHPKPKRLNNKGNSHHAGEVRSTAMASLCSLDIGAPHSGQYAA